MRMLPAVATMLLLCGPGVWAQAAGYEKVTTGPVVTTPGESLGFAWGDVDGDDDLDLYVANGVASSNDFLFRNDGGGTFTHLTTGPVVTDGGNSDDAAFADIDNDGDLDLFVCNRASTNALFRNQGGIQGGVEGTFVKAGGEGIVNDSGDNRACAFGDIDGDGDLDLFVARSLNQNNVLYRNMGGLQAGTIGTFTKLFTGQAVTDGGSSYDCCFGDIDDDNDLDLFVANSGTQSEFLYLNDGFGAFTKVTTGPAVTAAGDSHACAFGDLDGDLDLDLVVGNFLQNTGIYLNQGGDQAGTIGTFVQVTTGAAATDEPATNDLALGDYDGDGDLDLALANCCTSGNQLYTNTGSGGQFALVTTGPLSSDGGACNAIGFADCDSDADLDLFVANSTSTSGSLDFLYRYNKMGTFTKVTTGPLATDVLKTFETALGDMDGDGDLDAFCANSDQENNALYENQGGHQSGVEGTFKRVLTGALIGDGGDTWAAAWGDKDGDGDLDLATADRSGNPNNNNGLYQNLGGQQGGPEGTFFKETNSQVVLAGGTSRDCAWGDMDGDGDLDLVFANSNFEGNFLYRNNGGAQGGVEGNFTALNTVIAMAAGDNYGCAWGDKDSDGDLDLFIANRAGDNFLFTNTGFLQGGFEGFFVADKSGPIPNDGGNSFGGAWGDKDGDGDLDLFVSNGDTVNFLYTNLGGAQGGAVGTFERVTTGPVATDPAASREAAWRDVDNDGDLDLFVPNVFGADNYLYLNDGDGNFVHSDGIVTSDGGNSRAAAFGDLNRDGDLDLVVTNHGEPKGVYENVSPPLADPLVDIGHGLAGTKGVPILNALGTCQPNSLIAFQIVQGKNGAQAGFFIGASAILAPFKGGVLVPAPNLVFVVQLDGTGFLVLSGTWPSGVPSGFQTYFQAWIVDPAAVMGYAATNAIEATAP